jgi:hypothetical protein
MSELKKPYKPWPPSKYEFKEKVEKRYIYRFTETLLDEEGYDEESREVEKPKKDINEVDLGWLVSQVPEGISLDQIKLEFGFRTSSMAYEDHYIRFYYEELIPEQVEAYEAAKRKYKKNIVKYENDLKVYEAAMKEKEIKDAEKVILDAKEKLDRLRSG